MRIFPIAPSKADDDSNYRFSLPPVVTQFIQDLPKDLVNCTFRFTELSGVERDPGGGMKVTSTWVAAWLAGIRPLDPVSKRPYKWYDPGEWRNWQCSHRCVGSAERPSNNGVSALIVFCL